MIIKELNTIEEFNDFIKEGTVCIDFWAPWCGPCVNFAPTFVTIAQANTSIKFAKVNIDNNPQAASVNQVKSIPTVILFKNGVQAKMNVGRMNEDELQQFVTT